MRIEDLERALYKDPLMLRRHRIARHLRRSWNRYGKKRVQKTLTEAQGFLDDGNPSAALVWAVAGFEALMQSVLGPCLKALASPLDEFAEELVNDFFHGNAKADRFRKLLRPLLAIDFMTWDNKAWKDTMGAVQKRNTIIHKGERVGRKMASGAIRAVIVLVEQFDAHIQELAPDRLKMEVQLILEQVLSSNERGTNYSSSQ